MDVWPNIKNEAAVKATTIAAMDIISNVGPRIKLGCSDMTNWLSANLDEVKFDKKDSIEAEEVNNASAFVNMKPIN